MAESSLSNTYDMPVMVGAAVVGAIAIGLFFYMAREPIAPPAPTQPTSAPLNAAAAPVVMIETDGTGQAGNQQGGGPAPIGGGPAPAGGAGPTPGFGGGKLKAG